MFDLNYNILRFFTVYSENQPNSNTGGLMIGKFGRLANEGEPLTVHGDGEYKRDYIHVSDVAKACIASIESKVRNEIFNVGTGTNISVNGVVDIIKKFKDVKVLHEANPRGYARDTLADISKAKKLLGWEPEIEQVQGITNTYKRIFNE